MQSRPLPNMAQSDQTTETKSGSEQKSIYNNNDHEGRNEGHDEGHEPLHSTPVDTRKSTFFSRFCGGWKEDQHTNHIFSNGELEQMKGFESMDYLPQNSKAYRTWMWEQLKTHHGSNNGTKKQPGSSVDAMRLRSDKHWDKWVVMGLVGFFTGVTGFLLKSLTEVLIEAKYEFSQEALDEGKISEVFFWIAGISCLMVLVSSSLVVFVAPEAAGSGVPAVIGYLNGVYIHHLYDLRVFFVKFFGTILAVSSGLPVGPEGPMVYMGATLGKHLSQGNPKKCHPFLFRCIRRFRTLKFRRDFISAGAASGIASAFGAPVGGMLFAMEEVASFWNLTLACQIFFACMVATFTTDVLITSFKGFKAGQAMLGAINEEAGILFGVSSTLTVNVLIFLPTIVIGCIGGVLGALFTSISVKIARFRKTHVEPFRWRRILEPLMIVLIMSTIAVFLPANFHCQPYDCLNADTRMGTSCLASQRHPLQLEPDLHRYQCARANTEDGSGSVSAVEREGRALEESIKTLDSNPSNITVPKTYNPAASLLYVTGETAVEHLFSRHTQYEFDYHELFALLLCYFPLAVWCAGSAVSSGLVVPILMIGACLGRIVGLGLTDMTGDLYLNDDWNWIDPGGFALIGSAAFFGGVSRLTISLTVIMMEITNDIRFLLPIMTAVLVSRLVADKLTHSLYHALLDVKCVPFINNDAPPSDIPLDLLPVSKIMSSSIDVVAIERNEVSSLVELLRGSAANAFPAVERVGQTGTSAAGSHCVFRGIILRKHLLCLLRHPENPTIRYEDLENLDEIFVHKFKDHEENRILKAAEAKAQAHNQGNLMKVDIEPLIDVSAISVGEDFPTSRAFIMFRSMGLRHLTVVDKMNRPVGMITRKDLIGMHIEHAVHLQSNPLLAGEHAHHT